MASFIVFVLIVTAVAAFGGSFAPGAWYAGLAKPALTPPDWIFPVVWPLLYLAIATAGWLLWRARREGGAVTALWLWSVQLLMNGGWSWLFFGLHATGVALAEIVLLWLLILATALAAGRVRPLAAWLLAPYLVWVAFAVWLNFGVWRLNG